MALNLENKYLTSLLMRSNENALKLICHFLQMMMTLKLMGLAFEVHDSGEASDNLDQKYRKIDPSLLDMFHYIFTHAGILTGKKDSIKKLLASS
jgi:hypothetical protein